MEPAEWFWEGHIQRRVQDFLRADGWSLVSSADTSSRETGIDLVLERARERLDIEVKGWPSTTYRRGPKAGQAKPTNPTVQARHWYAGALLTTALLRNADQDARVAIALPDFPRYRDLLRRTAASLMALRVETILVPEEGDVSWIDPRHLPQPTRKPVTHSAPAVEDSRSSARISAGGASLHEAMVAVLRQAPNNRLTAGELAVEINRRGLYRMRDGRPVAPGQIHARAHNYDHLFVGGDGAISLRH